jgi:hypothetical protein
LSSKRDTYTPSRETVQNLRDLYELEGSYAAVARSLNRGRRQKDFTARQVSRMLNRENVGGSGSGYTKQDAPLPVRLSQAQQRSLQRKAKVESGTYRRAYESSDAPKEIYDSIKKNIDAKRERLKDELSKASAFGQRDKADKLREQIKKLNQFDNELKEAADKAQTYKDWKGMQDAKTP